MSHLLKQVMMSSDHPHILVGDSLTARGIHEQVPIFLDFRRHSPSSFSLLNAAIFQCGCYHSAPSCWPIKGVLLATFFASPSSLMTIFMSLLLRCSGRGFFVSESTSEAVSQSDLSGVSTPAGESAFTPWSFKGVSLGKIPGHGRLV